LGSKRGSAGLEAPEETYGLSTSVSSVPDVPEPAPAGAFQRAKYGAEDAAAAAEEDVYVPKRESKWYRIKAAIPRGMAGRIVLGCGGLLVVGTVAVGVLAVRRYLTHDERFAMATSSEIEIGGNEHLTRAQILSVFGADLERNIFKIPLAQRREDLERLPWVAHASVMRLLPNHLRIAVTERMPVAFVRQGTELGLVDANGVLLDMPSQDAGNPEYSFPVLTGLNPADPLSTRAARMAVYAKFMHDLDAGGEKLTQTLSEVDVSNPEDVKAVIQSGNRDLLVHFGDQEFLNRYHEFKSHLQEWLTNYPKLASADMRYERQVVLEMDKGAVVPTNTAAGASAVTPAAPVAVASGGAAAAPAKLVEPPKAAVTAHKEPVKGRAEKPKAKRVESKSLREKLALARSKAGHGAAPVAHSSGAGQR